jgi:hypothetical protein
MSETQAPVVETGFSDLVVARQVGAPSWQTTTAIVIATDEDYRAVAQRLDLNKQFQKAVTDFFSPMKADAHRAHKTIVAREASILEPALADERRDKAALATFHAEQERLRQIEEARVREEARRIEEARRLEEAAAMEREAAARRALAATETDEILRAVADAEAAEIQAAADAHLAAPVETPAVIVAPAVPKVKGLSYTTRTDVQVTDLLKLIQHVSRNPRLVSLLDPNMPALRKLAQSGTMDLPGVQVVTTQVVAQRRSK